MNSQTKETLQSIAERYGLPSITTWQQGYFMNQDKYKHMGEDWRKEQIHREQTLIRPYGGTNNALFQITGSEYDQKITAYLQTIAEYLAKLEKKGLL